MDGWTDRSTYRDEWTHLKVGIREIKDGEEIKEVRRTSPKKMEEETTKNIGAGTGLIYN